MIANLMMYCRPELEDAHNRYWALIRKNLAQAGIGSPKNLSQDAEEFSVWNNPNLVLSQTCGMPYRKWLHPNVTLIGTPDFDLLGCPKGYYRSAFIVRKNDPHNALTDYKDANFTYNQDFSQSGYAAAFAHLKPLGFWFKNRSQSHQHLASARAVAESRADIAALDAVTWRLIRKYEDFAHNLRVLTWTKPTPGLPYIAGPNADQEHCFNAVKTAITQLNADDRELLGIKDLIYIPPSDYLSVANPE